MRALPVIVFLAGCSTGPMVPQGTDYVRVSVEGPLTGRRSDTIFANEKLRREVPVGAALTPRVSWSALPDGTYAQARALVERRLPRITLPQSTPCPADAATQRIDVRPPIAGLTSVQLGCGPDAVDRVVGDLTDLLPPWRKRGGG